MLAGRDGSIKPPKAHNNQSVMDLKFQTCKVANAWAVGLAKHFASVCKLSLLILLIHIQ
jgi:hypothetical protein